VHRDYEVDPERVFDGFVGAYDDPRPDWVLTSECDLRVGGAWELQFRPPGLAAFSEHRVFTAVERPRRLAYRVTIEPADAARFSSDVEVRIVPSDGVTRLTLSQSGFPDDATRDDFATAWPDVLAMIADRIG
jgi:uncharacterized protein YndB with AHSA1/START domain